MNVPITTPECLLKFKWVKLPRETLPQGKGVMGAWAKLASRAAFRPGQAKYCGHTNDVPMASWVGGIVGLKSILGIKNREKALAMMDKLSELGYISYTLDKATKKLTYKISDWVVECSGAACSDGAVYATDGYGFLCLPRNITQRLVDQKYKFEESDAWLDLWCHTVWQDSGNAFSHMAPAVQFGQYGALLTLEKLGDRWGWEKTKVWRFFQKHGDVFTLHKLPGSYGCLVFNSQYPTGAEAMVPCEAEIMRILHEMRIMGQNVHFSDTDHERMNRFVTWYSKKLLPQAASTAAKNKPESRVALSLYAYISLCKNCSNCSYDCWGDGLRVVPTARSKLQDSRQTQNYGGYDYG
ncbi:MAG: hypothetical protein LBT21_01485 [Oscillospiraceae bacterium]|jgi:hypothetical protein|nr:hypothetical protein [Oscillospiraceae bacterium]